MIRATPRKESTMKQAYPVILTPDGDFIVVYVPDLELNTQGETVAEAMEMARDAIGMCGCYLQDEKRDIPLPSALSSVSGTKGSTVTLVDVDFAEYRRRHECRTVRKNVTIPSWLNEQAEAAGVNFSAVLQNALRTELHLS